MQPSLELQPAALDPRLFKNARDLRGWGLVLAAVVGVGLQVLVWTGKGSWLEHVEVSLFFVACTVLPGVLMVRGNRRQTSRLRRRLGDTPLELRTLTLQWVAHAGAPCGRLTFQFSHGACWYVTLPAETARVAFETLGSAYPWADQRASRRSH